MSGNSIIGMRRETAFLIGAASGIPRVRRIHPFARLFRLPHATLQGTDCTCPDRCWPIGIDDPRQFRRDSRLLILHGQRDETGSEGPWNDLIDETGFHILRGETSKPE